MTTKIIKIQIIKPLESTWEEFGKVLNELQYQTWKTANKTIQMLWDYNNFNYTYKQRFGKYINLKEDEILSKSNGKGYYKNIISDIGNQLKEECDIMCSNGKHALFKMVENQWNIDFEDIINGRKSIANFKRNIPIEIHNKQMIEENRKELMLKRLPKSNSKYDEYTMDIQLISKSYATKIGRKNGWYKVLLSIKDSYQKVIIDRIINGEYNLSMSKIIRDKSNKKLFINLAYTFTPTKSELNKHNILGIDLGVNIPAMMATNYDKYYSEAVGDATEINNFQNQIRARHKRLQKSRKWCGEGSIGHGTKTRLKPLDKLSGKIANFKDTKNHCWSRYIVNQAIKLNCGTIQMEDLSGIAKENTFLKTWTYYDLQQKIKYIAEEKGITVIFIDPKYTSARCNECGHIHRSSNKDKWRPSQDKFICEVCGHTDNADVNASKNIAMKNIDKIIDEQIDFQNSIKEVI